MNNCWMTLAVLALSITACAARVSESRTAYITAHDHGWIEFVLRDPNVLSAPAADPSTNGVRPSSCQIQLQYKGESYVSEEVYPTGEVEPFIVDTGFRFPVPAGRGRIEFQYSGCDFDGDEPDKVQLGERIRIFTNTVTVVEFDGETLFTLENQPNAKVTLDNIYEAVTGSKKGVE